MELQQIKYFKVLANTENITLAAKELEIAQPSLSQMLKRLESELGTPLFDRKGKKIVLNSAGKIFLRYAEEVLQSLENAKLELSEFKSTSTQKADIYIDCASPLIAGIVKRIRSEYPKITPRIHQGNSSEAEIKIFADTFLHQGALLLAEERIGIALNKKHPLASKDKIYKKDLENLEFIEINKSFNTTVKSYKERYSFKNTPFMAVDSVDTLRDLINMNLGIAFAPEKTWCNFYGDILFKPIWDMPQSRYIQLTQNTKKHLTKAARCCKISIKEFFEEYNRNFR